MPDAILATLDTSAEKRGERETLELARYYARTADEIGMRHYEPILKHAAGKPAFPSTTAAILDVNERKTHIHLRGEYQQPGDGKTTASLANWDAGSAHLALNIADLASFYERTRDELPYLSAPQQVEGGPWAGGLVVYLRDPDGNSVELVDAVIDDD